MLSTLTLSLYWCSIWLCFSFHSSSIPFYTVRCYCCCCFYSVFRFLRTIHCRCIVPSSFEFWVPTYVPRIMFLFIFCFVSFFSSKYSAVSCIIEAKWKTKKEHFFVSIYLHMWNCSVYYAAITHIDKEILK